MQPALNFLIGPFVLNGGPAPLRPEIVKNVNKAAVRRVSTALRNVQIRIGVKNTTLSARVGVVRCNQGVDPMKGP